MQCFQPQLAQFQISASFQKMAERLTTPGHPDLGASVVAGGHHLVSTLMGRPSRRKHKPTTSSASNRETVAIIDNKTTSILGLNT